MFRRHCGQRARFQSGDLLPYTSQLYQALQYAQREPNDQDTMTREEKTKAILLEV